MIKLRTYPDIVDYLIGFVSEGEENSAERGET